MVQPTKGPAKSITFKSALTKSMACQASYEKILIGLVEQEVMHHQRMEELMMMIGNVADRVSRDILSADVNVGNDAIKVFQEPGTTNILVDLLYYEIRSDSFESDEMSV